jgi:hypothetical protein
MQGRRHMMTQMWIEELHTCRSPKFMAIDDDREGATVSRFREIEAHNGKRRRLMECEESRVIIRPKVEPVIHLPAFTTIERFCDETGFAKRACEDEVRNGLLPNSRRSNVLGYATRGR